MYRAMVSRGTQTHDPLFMGAEALSSHQLDYEGGLYELKHHGDFEVGANLMQESSSPMTTSI